MRSYADVLLQRVSTSDREILQAVALLVMELAGEAGKDTSRLWEGMERRVELEAEMRGYLDAQERVGGDIGEPNG